MFTNVTELGLTANYLGALSKAEQTNNKWWQQALKAFAQYGPSFINSLKSAGVIKNDNDLFNGNLNATAFGNYQNATNGTLDPNQYGKGSLFGLNTNTILIIVLAVVLAAIYLKK